MYCDRSANWLSSFPRLALVPAMLVALTASAGSQAVADVPAAYTVEVSDVAAKVGETTVLVAKLKPRDGFKILHAYNNRVGQLSSFDDGVAFESKMVPATDEDDALVFAINVRPTKSGSHPINGIFRVGYIEGSEILSMVSVPLIANVVGTN